MEKIKKDILVTLSNMPTDELDKMRDTTQLELKTILHNYHLARDEELVYRHELRTKLLGEGNSFNKVEQMLRADQKLYELKRKILALSTERKETELKIEIVNNYFWKSRT